MLRFILTFTTSGRMRTTTNKFQPLITLAIAGEQLANISLPFSSSDAWQCVGQEMELNIDTSAELTVTLTGNSASPVSGSAIYFDDICVSLQSKKHYELPTILMHVCYSYCMPASYG